MEHLKVDQQTSGSTKSWSTKKLVNWKLNNKKLTNKIVEQIKGDQQEVEQLEADEQNSLEPLILTKTKTYIISICYTGQDFDLQANANVSSSKNICFTSKYDWQLDIITWPQYVP